MSAVMRQPLMGFARSAGRAGGVHLDTVTIALTLALTLLGLVMVTSASVSIASQETGQPFYYLERQLALVAVGGLCAALTFSIRTEWLERASVSLLAVALVLLVVVLLPGLGHFIQRRSSRIHSQIHIATMSMPSTVATIRWPYS